MYKHVQNSVLLSFQQCLLSFPMLVVTPFLVIAEITSLIVEMTVSDTLFLNKKYLLRQHRLVVIIKISLAISTMSLG